MSITDHDPEDELKAERLAAFFACEEPDREPRVLEPDLEVEGWKRRKEKELDEAFDLHLGDWLETEPVALSEAPSKSPLYSEAVTNDDDAGEVIRQAPVPTPYDKARQRLEEAEVWCDLVEPGSEEHHLAMSELADAKRAFKTETERSTDDVYRKRRAIDVYRAGEGREEYNASRRRKRKAPNARLKDMTPEERAQHVRDKNADDQWKAKQRKKGKSEAEIEAGLAILHRKRAAKRAGI